MAPSGATGGLKLPASNNAPQQQTERVQRRLRIVRSVALIDLVLLCALVAAALTGQRALVQVLGPLHGINYLLLVVIVAAAALDGIWGWWFPVVVLCTAGVPGALIGEWLIRRRLTAQSLEAAHDRASDTATPPITTAVSDAAIAALSGPGESVPEPRKERS